MNLKFKGVGAEPKKVAILAGLLLVAAYFFISNRSSSSTSAAYVAPQQQADSAEGGPRASGRQIQRQRPGQGRLGSDKPSLKPKKDEDVDRTKIDPTLHTELLAKLKDVKVEGGTRSLFDIGAAPLVAAVVKQPEPPKIIPDKFYGPMPKPPPPPPPPDPIAPPIPLKFYGFVNHATGPVKRAFFLDGEEIVIAAEGDMIKKRYKIVRIGINSAVVEDTQFKGKNTQQTLPLVAELEG